MPIEPGLQNIREIRKINQIVKMWMVPCAADPEIWIEAAFAALGPTLIEFLYPGSVELIEMPLGRYHGVGGKMIKQTAKKLLPNFVDVSDKIWKFTFLGIIERILFWWMIIDLVTEFFYNWESLALQMEHCRPDDVTGTGHAGDGMLIVHDFGWQPVAWIRDFDPEHLIDVTKLVTPASHSGNVGFALTTRPFFGKIGTLQCRLVDWTSGKVLHESGLLPPGQPNNKGIGHFRLGDHPLLIASRVYQVEGQAFDWPVDLGGSTVTVGGSRQ